MKIRFEIAIALLLAGCTNAPEPHTLAPAPPPVAVRLVQFAAVDNGTVPSDSYSADWNTTVDKPAVPKDGDPADYGARADGAYWQDDVVQAQSYKLGAGARITTHTHGLVIYASSSITIDGEVLAHGLGAQPGAPGYASTRAALLNLYRGYGETDPQSGEPLLWGAGGADCMGGGYIILNAPRITLNGVLDAGSDCGQAGVVYLEGNVSGTGAIDASLIIHRGATA